MRAHPAEYELVRLVIERCGRPIGQGVIARAIFDQPFRVEDRTVDNPVVQLCRTLDHGQQERIRTVRGVYLRRLHRLRPSSRLIFACMFRYRTSWPNRKGLGGK